MKIRRVMLTARDNTTHKIVVVTLFGGLAALLTIFPLDFPFPLVPYLRFDAAEIPVFVAFMLFGPTAGLATCVTYLGVLLPITMGEWLWPIGPFLKFFATASQVLGMSIGFRVYRLLKRGGYAAFLIQLTTLGMILRIMVMTLANYAVLTMTAQVEFIGALLRTITGWSLSSSTEVIVIILVLTALFNALHTPLSMMPAALLVKRISREGSLICYRGAWMIRAIGKDDLTLT
ncbi:MAG: hypothetical protein QXI52_01715 [Nitrososphaerota archaeon]